ncbi:protein NLRC5-like isoform X2 [Megalobrama amblycephala]|uniref:protein NLRC5-like isoform X2 n=1 Tax=Megalobrama amblycephala TaxID=75352 RepID=UPI0020142C19|nr:protein NLRC5-like isoform X2 [Megalobrama amblycephala]
MSLSGKHSVRSGSHVSSSVSLKSDRSKDGVPPKFSGETPSSNKRLQYETLDSDVQTHRNHKNFKDNLLWIFQDLESKIITFLKKELEKFKKILQNENRENLVKDFNENRCSINSAALDLTIHYLREMKQDEAADDLEVDLVFIHQLKCGLKKKYQCVFEGMAKHGDSTLLNNIYTDLYITQGGSEQVNTEHEVRQIEVASRHHESQEIQVKCTNLFEAPAQEEKIRTVLTKGVAGIGKSVSVQKFVLDWAEGKENQDISFIFPLPFREMNLKEKEKLSLMDFITLFFPETKGLNLTRRNQFKVLFILDGLDECRLPLKFDCNETWSDVSSPASLDVLLTNLMKGNLLPSALIWITTRPAAASKIPPDCIDRLTEIRGFSDAQKEEYFKKRFTDQNQANTITDHVKKTKSLFIMCHIPVFCWISATVLQNILEEKRNNDVKNISKTLQKSNTEDTPKTLTQMYTHFLRFQIQQSHRKYDGEYAADVSWDKNAILSLGKLAFHQLQRNNVIFYDTDLEACGIDVYKASVYSGMCTQIFKEETGIILGTMYCFVHLSIQEFIAALYAHLFLDINKKSVFVHESTEQENKNETMIDFLKTAVDEALESDNGHLDLFLRFLLGLSLQSNRRLLRGLLTQQDTNDQINKEIVQYVKQKLEDNLSAERSINLFYCLNELNDQTLVKEIQTHLSKGSISSGDLSPAQWSALVFVLLTSEEELEEFELQKFKKSDECLIRLSAVIKTSRRALLNDCNLTDKSCSALAAVLGSDNNLKELNMNNNNLQDSGVKLLCTGLKNLNCKLEILRLSNCSVTEEGYKALASALRSNPSHLIELDLTGNDPGQSGVKELSDLLQDPNCQLKTLSLSGCSITEEQCVILTSALKSNPSHLRELNLSGNKLGNTGVKHLCDILKDSPCKLERLRLSYCSVTEKGYKALASALRSNPSHLIELDLTGNDPGQSGVKELSDLLQDPNCQLKTLRLSNCSVTEEGYKALASALRSNPSHLIELDLTGNITRNTGVKHLCDILKDSNCKLKILRLSNCSVTEEGYKALALVLRSNPSHLIELDLTGNDPGQSGVKELNGLLQDPNCQLKTLRFLSPAADEACQYVKRVVGKNPLLLRELNLSEHELGDTQVNQIAALLQDKHCRLDTLTLNRCSITEEQCVILTSALKSNPSHLRELNLSWNKLENTGVKHLCDVLKDSHCKLERLRLSNCSVTEEGYKALASALRSNSSHLIELDLTGNDPGQSGVKELNDLLQDPNCQLKTLRFLSPAADEACQYVKRVVGKNPLLLRELNLIGHELGDKRVNQIAALLQDKHCRLNTLTLNRCSITEKQCVILTSALKSNSSHLRELNLSWNKLGNTGVKHLCDVLKDSHCKLERLRLSNCSVIEECYKALASALRSNPSHLIELDLTGNDPGESGVKELNDLLQDPNCQLKTLRFVSPAADEACQYVKGVMGKNPLLLRELNLSEHELGDTRVNQIAALLQDKHCRLNTLTLNRCRITEKQCLILTSALKSNPSHLRELNLSWNKLGNTGVKHLCDVLKDSHCKLERLRLSNCSVTEEGYKALASALRSNPSHLIELDLTGNDPGQSGVKELNDLLQDPNCQLKTLRFVSPAADEACQYVSGIVGKNLLLLRELNLSEHELGDTRVNQIAALLQDKHCRFNTLNLNRCRITEKQCVILTSALKSNLSHLRDLNLSRNELGNTGVKHLCDVLKDSHCKLERLRLSNCSVTEEVYKALASALRSNPSHLIELDLTGNDPGQSGVKELNDLLQDPNCQLKTLRFLSPAADEACQYMSGIGGKNLLLLRELNLSEHELGDTRVNQIAALLQDKHCRLNTLTLSVCSITEKQCVILTSALKSNLSHLRELNLSGNELGNTGVKHLYDILKDSHCKLERMRLSDCSMTEEGCSALMSALKSNSSHLRELDLSVNKLGDSGVKNFSDLLMNPQFKLEKLELSGCSITEKQCVILTSALKSNPSHLRELNLSENKLGDSGVKNLSDLLMNPQFKLEKLDLSVCSITEKQCVILTSALKSNPSHLRELNLSWNELGDSGVKNLSDLLMIPQFKLEKLHLQKCGITDVSSLTQSLTNSKALQFLKDLDLSYNKIGDSNQQLHDVLRDSNCVLRVD